PDQAGAPEGRGGVGGAVSGAVGGTLRASGRLPAGAEAEGGSRGGEATMRETAISPMTLTLPSDLEIQMTKVLNAPRQRVWEAWTQPEHIQHWWGPKG